MNKLKNVKLYKKKGVRINNKLYSMRTLSKSLDSIDIVMQGVAKAIKDFVENFNKFLIEHPAIKKALEEN
jgi:hypothetical protein